MTRTALRPTRSQLTAGGSLCARSLVTRHNRAALFVAAMPMGSSVVSKWLPVQFLQNSFETTLIANPDPGGGGV